MPATEPHVAIVLVNWNGRDLTLDCLRSLAAITYRPHTVIVVDNASRDGSVEAIRKSFPDVDLLPMAENLRFAGGNNAGIRRALEMGAEMVLLLNNDTTVAPDFLSRMVRRIRGDAGTGIVTPAIYYHDVPEVFWFAGGVVSFWTGTMRHVGIRERDRGQYTESHTTDYATGCCFLTTRDIIGRVGMLDESYYIYTEDADFCMRVRKAGYSIVFEPSAKVWHKLSVSTGGHTSWFKMKNKFVSNLRFFGRYAAWYQWLVIPWMSILVNGLAAIRYMFQVRTR